MVCGLPGLMGKVYFSRQQGIYSQRLLMELALMAIIGRLPCINPTVNALIVLEYLKGQLFFCTLLCVSAIQYVPLQNN